MEGNDCYKFSTIQNYIRRTGGEPIRLALDIGCNLGSMSLLMREYFAEALIFAFEPVPACFRESCKNLAQDEMVKVLPFAVTGQHRFQDDLGKLPHPNGTEPLQLFLGLPASGPGWIGGSQVHRRGESPDNRGGYEEHGCAVTAITLDEAVSAICTLCSLEQIDYVKMDCEGCENSALGCAEHETLRKIRFISGEYHNAERFYKVMRKLYETHYVNLVGDGWGSFFAERKGMPRTILEPLRDGMLTRRPSMSTQPIDWHLFRDEFVLPSERRPHGLSPKYVVADGSQAASQPHDA